VTTLINFAGNAPPCASRDDNDDDGAAFYMSFKHRYSSSSYQSRGQSSWTCTIVNGGTTWELKWASSWSDSNAFNIVFLKGSNRQPWNAYKNSDAPWGFDIPNPSAVGLHNHNSFTNAGTTSDYWTGPGACIGSGTLSNSGNKFMCTNSIPSNGFCSACTSSLC